MEALVAEYFLFVQPSFPIMVRPIEKAPISLSLEQVAVRAGHEVLTNISQIVSDPQGILDQQPRPRPIQLLNIIIILISYNIIYY